MAVSIYSGTTATDHAYSNNLVTQVMTTTSGDYRPLEIAKYTLVTTQQTTVYLKVSVSSASASNVQIAGYKISARRIK